MTAQEVPSGGHGRRTPRPKMRCGIMESNIRAVTGRPARMVALDHLLLEDGHLVGGDPPL